jgi:hypothetical protein
MNVLDVVTHFGSKESAAGALKLSVRCIELWAKAGHIPLWSQLAIQGYTRGKLKADK